MGPLELFLNSGKEAKEASVVEAPAFSLTKVMAVLAPLVTTVAAYVTAQVQEKAFSTGQITTLIVALIAFLALTASADVLSRAIATAATKGADGRLRMLRFETPLKAELKVPKGGHDDVEVVAASDAEPPEFLCLGADRSLVWAKAKNVTFPQQ